VARCWWYLASCFDDGLLACRDEEEANVLDFSDRTGSGDNIISKTSVFNPDQTSYRGLFLQRAIIVWLLGQRMYL
jgi:hypothetical protein